MNKLFGGFLWRFLERAGAQIVTLIVSIVLARILSPEEYGTVAIVTVIITILNVFVESGLGNALIQKRDADIQDFSTVFYFNIILSIFLYFILFVISPIISDYYDDETLSSLTRVLGITVLFAAIKNVLHAYVSRMFQFKKFFFATLGGTLVSAVVGIAMAYCGFGVWALVCQHLTNTIIDTIVLWIVVKWKPRWTFSFSKLKNLAKYGYKLLLSSLMNTIYNNFRQLIIGKYYESSELAYYNRGKQFPFLVVTNVNVSIDSVLFPALSSIQNDKEKVNFLTRESIKIATFVMWPILVGILVIADRLVPFVLTDKWNESIPFLRIFCLIYLFFPIQTSNLNAIKARGKSGAFLYLSICECAIGTTLLFIGIKMGTLWIAIMYLISTVIFTLVLQLCSWKINGYSIINQFKDLFPQLIGTGLMGAIVFVFGLIDGGIYIALIQILIGVGIYFVFSHLFIKDSFNKVVGVIRGILSSKNKDKSDMVNK